jgi:hypothetical protein
MTATASAPRPPANSRLVLLAAGLAGPLNVLATMGIAVALLVMGAAKFLAGTIDTTMIGGDGADAQLLALATGGIITTPWGPYLVGGLQIALGLGLLLPAARGIAALGCLLAVVAVVVGGIVHRADLSTGSGLNPAGVALVILALLLLCGAALGARSAARRVGAAA